MSLPPGTIHKRSSFSFAGHTVLLDLSQDVFSSYDVDRGTRLLLKSLSEPVSSSSSSGAGQHGVPFSPGGSFSVLDVGCGAGVLGLALKTAYPNIDLWGIDRDAFAVGLSEHNAALNGICDARFRGALGTGLGEAEPQWDLIVSNLPAKAGNPVLREMLRCFAASHTDGGRAAVVVVKTLEGEVADFLTELGAELLLRSGGTGHTVFHFRRPDGDRCWGRVRGRCLEGSLEPYIRRSVRHEIKGVAVPLATVYNLPDFDSLGYASKIAAEILAGLRPEGSALIWGPGQGFVPAFLARSPYAAIERYTLASRDLLSLKISGQNLEAAGVERKNTEMIHAAGYPGLSDRFDLQILFPEIRTGGGSWHGPFQQAAVRAMEPSGRLLLVAESAVVHRLLKRFGDLRTTAGRKKRGFRGVLLERKE